MDRLYLTYADRRWRAGMESRSVRSSFLEELPEGPVERIVAGGFRSWGRAGRRGEATAGAGSLGSAWSGFDPADDPGPAPWWRSGVSAEPAEAPSSEASGGRSESDGLRYDYSDSQVPLELAPGVRVVHPRFGEGVILAVRGAGRGTKVDIEFDDVGTKKVIVAYSGLRPV